MRKILMLTLLLLTVQGFTNADVREAQAGEAREHLSTPASDGASESHISSEETLTTTDELEVVHSEDGILKPESKADSSDSVEVHTQTEAEASKPSIRMLLVAGLLTLFVVFVMRASLKREE